MKPIKKIAVIHDMCTVGKAAMTNILPVLSCLGHEVCPVPAMVLSSHTGGYGKPAVKRLGSFVSACGKHLKDQGICFSYIFVGYLGSKEAVDAAKEFLALFPEAEVLLDPIMGDHGKFYSNFDRSYQESLLPILKSTNILTPNYTESCFLAEEEYEGNPSKEKLQRICERLESLGCSKIVITGVPVETEIQTMAVFEKGTMEIVRKKSVGNFYHGTGDLFAAVLVGNLMKGTGLLEAVEIAHNFVCKCIQYSDRYAYPEREGVILEPFLKDLCEIE